MTKERTVQVVVGALSAIALVAIIAVAVGGDIDDTTGRVLASALSVAAYLLVGLAGAGLARSGESWSWLGAVSMLVCLAGVIFAVALWWDLDDDDGTNSDWIIEAAGITLLFAIATSHGSLLLRHIQRRSELGQTVRYLTFLVAFLIAMWLSFAIGAEDHEVLDGQALAVLAILYLLGTVVSPLLRLVEPKPEP